MDKAKEVAEWMSFAQDDLDTAVLLHGQLKKSLNILCFHCQQAAEKFLKAYLVSQNYGFEKTHDLVFLLDCCKAFEPRFSRLVDLCQHLNPFAIITRYPSDLELTEPDAKSAVQAAQEIGAFVRVLVDG